MAAGTGALAVGELVELAGGCLALRRADSAPIGLIWPAGYTRTREPGRPVAVHNQAGIVVAHTGDRITTSGAESSGVEGCAGGAAFMIMGEVALHPLKQVNRSGGCASNMTWPKLLGIYRKQGTAIVDVTVERVSPAVMTSVSPFPEPAATMQPPSRDINTPVLLSAARLLAGADVLGPGREIHVKGGKVGEYEMEVSDGPTFFLAPGQRAIVFLHPRGTDEPPEIWGTLPVVNGQVIFYDGDCATRAGLVLTPYDGAGKELRSVGEVIDVALIGGSMPIASFEKLLTNGA